MLIWNSGFKINGFEKKNLYKLLNINNNIDFRDFTIKKIALL